MSATDIFDHGDSRDKFSDYYLYLKTLGKGAFGTVVLALDRITREKIAVKIICKRSSKEKYILQMRKEAKILSKLSHKNIIAFHHLRETETKIFIAMEWFGEENLKDHISYAQISEEKSKKIMASILEAVEYLHCNNIIHRDLKPENILIKENPLQVKIIDFGLSTKLPEYQMKTDKCGTLAYMAPEQFTKGYYNHNVDIWSCGVIMHLILTKGLHPFRNKSDSFESYIRKMENPEWLHTGKLSHLAQSLFLNLCNSNPLERYSAKQCLAHPWIYKCSTRIPITVIEEYRKHGDLIKLRSLLYSLMFVSQVGKLQKVKKLAPLDSNKSCCKRSPLIKQKSIYFYRRANNHWKNYPGKKLRLVINKKV